MAAVNSSSESPEVLVQLLERYAARPASSAGLVEQLRPFRLALRSTPALRYVLERIEAAHAHRRTALQRELTSSSYRSAYPVVPGFWPAIAGVWKVEADRLASEDAQAIAAVSALAGFTLSLCLQSPQNQTAAVYVPGDQPAPPRCGRLRGLTVPVPASRAHVEPQLRRVLVEASSFINLQDPKCMSLPPEGPAAQPN